MTDVPPKPDRTQDPEKNTPQPDENPQQREHLRDQARRRPGREDPAPASGGEGAAGAGGPAGFGAGG